MSWAQRLKRVFGIEIETCAQCGGQVRVMASKAKSAGFRQGRRGVRLGAGQSAVRQSSGFAAICRPVTVRLPAPGSCRGVAARDADWQPRDRGL